MIVTADDAGRDVRQGHRRWERAVDRAVIREWSAALERGDLELAVDRLGGPERQLELGLQVGDDADAGQEAEQEVG